MKKNKKVGYTCKCGEAFRPKKHQQLHYPLGWQKKSKTCHSCLDVNVPVYSGQKVMWSWLAPITMKEWTLILEDQINELKSKIVILKHELAVHAGVQLLKALGHPNYQ